MTEKTETRAAPQLTRFELFERTGWMFVTVDVFPELEDLPVQRFASKTGEFVHEVRDDRGLACSCPGWRKYAKCWHMRWVLGQSMGTERRIGTFLRRMPAPYESALLSRDGRWHQWLDENIVVVEPEKGSAATSS